MLVSIGDRVRPGTYRLHSVFRHAVNFLHRGQLVSVVDETVGPGPVNIVLRSRARAWGHLTHEGGTGRQSAEGGVGNGGGRLAFRKPRRLETCATADWKSALRVDPRAVVVAGCRYTYTPAQRYRSEIKVKAVDLRCFRRNLEVLGETLRRDSHPKSLAFLLDQQRQRNFRRGFERTYAARIERGVRTLFAGRVLEGVQCLKGCGLGLTPGGDDLLAGLLLGLHVLERLRGQSYRVAREAAFRTARAKNIFSNTMLGLAFRGLVFARLKELLMALTSDRAVSVRRCARALFALGNTSGADLATGLFLTLASKRERFCEPSLPRPRLRPDQGEAVDARFLH